METAYLAPDVLLRMILNKDLSLLNQSKVNLVTSSFCFYEVMSCLTKEEIKENTEIIAELFNKIAITEFKEITGEFETQSEERKEHLRGIALKDA